jgi:TP901 family phage tail tape measure protein
MASQEELKTIVIKANGVQAGNTIKELAKVTRDLRKELNTLAPTSEEFVNKTKRLREVTDRLNELRTGVTKQSAAWKDFRRQAEGVMIGVFGGNILSAAVSGIASFFTKGIQGIIKMADQFSDIKKVTSLTSIEVLKLNKDLSKIETRTPTSKLRELTVAAGKLGIDGRRDLLEFVKAADKIQIALGEDLGQDALVSIGKLVEVYKVNEKFGIEQGMLKVASSINSVGQASLASEPHLIDFLNQVGGTGETVGVSIDELVGLAGALDSVGLTAEVSATAYKDNIIEFVRDTEKWAKVAGFRIGELTEILKKEGTNEAFLQFVTRLRESSASEQEFLGKLQELKIDGTRGANVFLTIANNIKLVREQQDLANKSFNEGTSISNEAAEKQANTAALFEKAGKRIEGFLLGNAITKTIVSLYENFARLIVPIEKVSDALQQEIIDLGATELQINDVNTSQEDRVKLIKELQNQYPDYLKNINAETITNEELSKSIQKINDNLVDRLVLQKSLEARDEAANDVAAKKLVLLEQERGLREYLSKIAVEQGFKIKKGGTLEDQTKDVISKYDPEKSTSETSQLELLNTYLAGLKATRKEIDIEQKRVNQLTKNSRQLAIDLGLNSSKTQAPGTPKRDITGGGLGDGLSDSERKKIEKANEDYKKNTQKLIDDLRKIKIDAIKDEESREVAKVALEAKLNQEEIQRTKAGAQAKADLIKASEEKMYKDIETLRKKYGDERKKTEYESTVKNLNDNYNQQRIILAQQHIDGITTEKQYDEKIRQLDLDLLKQKSTASKDYCIDEIEAAKNLAEGKIKWTKEELEYFLDSLQKKQNAELASAKLKIINAPENSRARFDAEIELLDLQAQHELEIFKGTEEEKALIAAQYREQEKEMWEQYWLGNAEYGAQIATGLSNKLFDLQAQRLRNEETLEDNKYKQDIKRLDRKLKQGIINEDEYNSEREKIEQGYNDRVNAIKRKAFASQKAAAIIQATIEGILAVMKTYSAIPYPFNIPASILVGGLAATQIALIERQPMPEFARGTVLKGRSHDQGGIPLYQRGHHIGDAEGDEIIMTKGVYRNPEARRIASDLNQQFGGVRFDGYNTMTAPPRFAFGTVISAGGYSSTQTQSNISFEERISTHEMFMLQMAKEIKEMKATKLEAYINYDVKKRQEEDLARIQSR